MQHDMSGNQGDGFRFSIVFQGEEEAGFQEASGFKNDMTVDAGNWKNGHSGPHQLPNSNSAGRLVLKRGMMPGDSELMRWVTASLSGPLGAAIKTYNLPIHLVDAEGVIRVTWTLYNAYPVRCASAASNEHGEVLVESVEFLYEYMERTVVNTQ